MRVYSLLLRSVIRFEEVYSLLVQGGWIERIHQKMDIGSAGDPLMVLNLVEIQLELFRSVQNTEFPRDCRGALWREERSFVVKMVQKLTIERESIPFFELLISKLMDFIAEALQVFYMVEGATDSPEELILECLESLLEGASENTGEAIIRVIGRYSYSTESQRLLFAHPLLLSFFQEALLGPKSFYLTFVDTLAQSLRQYVPSSVTIGASLTLNRSAGSDSGRQFCMEALRGDSAIHRLEMTLKYAKSPYIDERLVIYKLWQELAATQFGRDWIFSTPGLLNWITDRGVMVEANPEALWRYHIVQQLISVSLQCRERIGDTGYLRLRVYVSDGPYYMPQEFRAIVADAYED